MSNPKVLTSDDFEKFVERGGLSALHRRQPMLVNGHVNLNGTKIKTKSLRLEQITFSRGLSVHDFQVPDTSLLILDCNFLENGLTIERVRVGHVIVRGLQAVPWINAWGCVCEVLTLENIKVGHEIDLHSLVVSQRVEVRRVMATKGFRLIENQGSDRINTPLVTTDNRVLARQCELAHIPVFMSHEAVSEWLKSTTPVKLEQAPHLV